VTTTKKILGARPPARPPSALIAAAPDLYAALDDLLPVATGEVHALPEMTKRVIAAAAALAKARGE
jgi:hypothetical protein